MMYHLSYLDNKHGIVKFTPPPPRIKNSVFNLFDETVIINLLVSLEDLRDIRKR